VLQSLLSVCLRLVSEKIVVDNSQTDKGDYLSHFVMVILSQCFYSVQEISTGQEFSLECGNFSDFPLPRNINRVLITSTATKMFILKVTGT
jgi:hypothetical protein